MILEQIDINVLRELRAPNHCGWLAPVEIAERLDQPAWRIRASLQNLRRQFLVRRGSSVLQHWGEFSITEHGMVELARADQLRLVR